MKIPTPDTVLPWMVFPHEDQLRHRYAALIRLRDKVDESGNTVSGVLKSDLLLAIDHSIASTWNGAVEDGVRRGVVAGALLRVIHDMKATGVKEPSINKAVQTYQEFALGKKYGQTEKPLPYSKQTILNCWTSSKAVAHYWAALEYAKTANSPYEGPSKDIFRSRKDFQQFIVIANHLANFAADFVPKRAKPPHPLVPIDEQVRAGLTERLV